jgi:hypothetical protein
VDWDNFFPWELSEPTAEDYFWCEAKVIGLDLVIHYGAEKAENAAEHFKWERTAKAFGRAAGYYSVFSFFSGTAKCLAWPRGGVLD